MNQSRNCIAIKPLLLLALLCAAGSALAQQAVGAVTLSSGPLLATRADGTTRVLARKSVVEPGDTLSTRAYVQIRFADGSQLILQPDTALTIDRFSYDVDKPQADDIALTLLRGGVRSTPGVLGKRSVDRVMLKTPVADVEMQGATVIVNYRAPSAESLAARRAYLLASTAALDVSPTATRSDVPLAPGIVPMKLAQSTPRQPALPPGLYVQVFDGLIHVTNPAGTANFAAGQFGFTPTIKQPPVILPSNPGIWFTPPPAFNSVPNATVPSKTPAPAAVDCEVR